MKDFKIYIFIASVLLVVYLVAQYNRPQPINWTETFNTNDKIPYGTYIVYNQLHDIFPKAEIQQYQRPVYNVLTDDSVSRGTYIIICGDAKLNEYDYDKLIKFIKKGNDVLIAAHSFGQQLNKALKVDAETESWYKNVSGYLKFTNKALDTAQVYTIDKNLSDGYFSNLDTAKALILGKNNLGHINFIKYNFDKGSLYLNANPLMFTNYSLLKKDGATYAALVFSHLKYNHNIIWDQYYSDGKTDEESPMRVFLHNPALRSAYYLSLFSLLLFVVYQIKRRQRIIPIIEPLSNSTLDFVNVVGQVYYEQRDNSNIAHKKASYLLEHLRNKYNLKTNVLNEEFVTALNHKSGADASLIRELINQVTLTRSGTKVSDRELIDLNKNIEQFYLQSR